MTKLMVAYRNFVSAPQNGLSCQEKLVILNEGGRTAGRNARRTPTGSKKGHVSPRDISRSVTTVCNWKCGNQLLTSIMLSVSNDMLCMYVCITQYFGALL
jgi:hypothetical protein